MEEKKLEQEIQNEMPAGWKGVIMHPEMSIAMILRFLNALNQRLCYLEDNLKVQVGEEILTVSEMYKKEEEKAQEELIKQQQKQATQGE